jgi:zinc protease
MLREGRFDDWLIEAVVNDYRQRRMRTWGENNSRSAAAMTDAFILKKQWSDEVDLYDRMAKHHQGRSGRIRQGPDR